MPGIFRPFRHDWQLLSALVSLTRVFGWLATMKCVCNLCQKPEMLRTGMRGSCVCANVAVSIDVAPRRRCKFHRRKSRKSARRFFELLPKVIQRRALIYNLLAVECP